MNKKGFTLIELAAIMVVLAVIMLIAFPAVKKVIGAIEQDAFKVQTELVVKDLEQRIERNDDYDLSLINASSLKSLTGINADNFQTVTATLTNGDVVINIVGKDKWDGLASCGTMGTIKVSTTGVCKITNVVLNDSCSLLGHLTAPEITALVSQGYIPIASASDLNQIRQDGVSLTFGAGTSYAGTYVAGLNKKYIQVANLDLESYSSGAGFVPLGSYNLPETGNLDLYFTGIYNGNCFTISNLTINRPGNGTLGLFGQMTDSALVMNLSLDNINITGGYWNIGGITGYMNDNTTIINTHTEGTITGTGEMGGIAGGIYGNAQVINSSSSVIINGSDWAVGGLVGYADTATKIESSYATGDVTGTESVGGLVGSNDGSINNTYSTGDVTGTISDIGGLVGFNSNTGTITNSYSTGTVTGPGGSTGGLVGTDDGGFGVEDSYYVSDPNNGYGEQIDVVDLTNQSTFPDWDFTKIWDIDDENPVLTMDDYYITGDGVIVSRSDTTRNECVAYKTYIDTNVINLISQGYIPIASASDLNKIRQQGLTLAFASGTPYAGTYVAGLDKKYIQVADIDLSVYGSGAGWVPLGVDRDLPDGGGVNTYFTGIYNGNCYSINNLFINRPSYELLGLFGYTQANTKISNVIIKNANITGSSSTGTLVGYAEDTEITNIYITTNLTPYNSDTVHAYASYGYAIGGVIGYGWVATVQHAYVTMTASNSYGTGGIAGEVGESTKIIDSHTNVNITGNGTTSYNAGGIVGWQYDSSVVDCSSTGTINSVRQIGGLVGGNEHASIINSHADVDVSGYGGTGIGGLVGEAYDSMNSTSIISNSYSTGDVTGTGWYTGGLVGYNEGYIINSYSHSNVMGTSEETGGFVGENDNDGVITNSYCTGTVSNGSVSTGGFAGANSATISDSYYYQNPNNGFATKVTSSEMEQSGTYTGWDFDNIWSISVDNYPTLKSQNSVMPDGMLFDISTNAIYGTISSNKNIVIPSNYLLNGRTAPVYIISNYSFNEQKIESVTLAEGLTTIGSYAFTDNLLTNLSLPSTMTKIGYYAFADNQITSVSIPSGVSTIEDHAFRDNALTSVTLTEGLTSIGYAAFTYNKILSLNIPNSVTEIDGFAFSNNMLTSLTIGSGVTTIGSYAFRTNYLLQGNATIDRVSGTVSIGSSAFNNNGVTQTTTITPVYLR